MSVLIDLECQSSSGFQGQSDKPRGEPPRKRSFVELFLKTEQIGNPEYAYTKTCLTQKGKTLMKICVCLPKRLFNHLDVLYCCTTDDQGLIVEEDFKILRNSEHFLIQCKKKKLQALKEMAAIKASDYKLTKILIRENGEIKGLFPQTLTLKDSSSIELFTKTRRFEKHIERTVLPLIKETEARFLNLYNKLFQKVPINWNSEGNSKKAEIEKEIYRFLSRSSVELRFDCTEGSAQYEQVATIIQTEEKKILQHLSHIDQKSPLVKCTKQFFEWQPSISHEEFYKAFLLVPQQKQKIKVILDIPQIQPILSKNNSSNSENKYNFNEITLALNENIQKLFKINQGGFGKIEIGNFDFWYMLIHDDNKDSNTEASCQNNNLKFDSQLKKKPLAVKSPLQPESQEQRFKLLKKQKHEKNIIRQLKGLSCQFVPKYYEASDFYPKQLNSCYESIADKLETSILSEVTNCYERYGFNFADLLAQKWETLTTKKILFYMIQLSQAIRFLQINKIFHLDIKPQNVLLNKNQCIKLTDFGEAVSEKLHQDDSYPAYSYPYGCPEIVSGSFDEKSDVFSFGVMLYEFLYGKDFTTIKQETLIGSYVQGNFMKRLFLNVEEMESLGDLEAFPILNRIIMMCLDSNPQNRPSMTWITVIFKKLFELMI